MKFYIFILSFFKKYNWSINEIKRLSNKYFFKYYIDPISNNMGNIILDSDKSNDYITLKRGLYNDAFKHGTIGFFFKENSYKITSSELAIGI